MVVIHLGVPVSNRFFCLCNRRILHDRKFNLSTDTKYVNCKKCCKRIGMNPANALPKRTRAKKSEPLRIPSFLSKGPTLI